MVAKHKEWKIQRMREIGLKQHVKPKVSPCIDVNFKKPYISDFYHGDKDEVVHKGSYFMPSMLFMSLGGSTHDKHDLLGNVDVKEDLNAAKKDAFVLVEGAHGEVSQVQDDLDCLPKSEDASELLVNHVSDAPTNGEFHDDHADIMNENVFSNEPKGCEKDANFEMDVNSIESVKQEVDMHEKPYVFSEDVTKSHIDDVTVEKLSWMLFEKISLCLMPYVEAGLLPSTVCTTVNKVCSSGMKAVMLGAQSIMLGLREVVVAGGMESMSNAPFLLPRIRTAKYLGDLPLIDSLMHDGLKDPLKNVSMGIFAEMCAEEMGISRAEQDYHAVKSFERAAASQATGLFKTQIVPVPVSGNKGKQITVVDFDEECSKFDPDKLENLPPVFKSSGTITAGNASSISDGAAALILTSTRFAEKHGLPPLAYIRGFCDAEQAPEKFPTSPSLAIPLALQQAGLHLKNIELFEINEAFSVVDLANQRLLGLTSEVVNIHGGASL
ncbi:hypothetical protein L7F22_021202 [Adiantum nelumboides]|nr:hypothetical protein [Adiantum nelumboides]